jgi:nucleoside-diphosphate-sugar epimerase
MRVFLAGASGVLGVRLVPLLAGEGHTVAGMTRTPAKADHLKALGAEPVVSDVFDVDRLSDAVCAFRPDVVLHQLTDLPDDAARMPEFAAANARIRREGTRNLLAAAGATGADRFVAQSVAWEVPGDGGAAVEEHERLVLDAGGVVIRYGRFHGAGTFFESEMPPAPRVHLDVAARGTLAALDAPSGVVVVTDEPQRT